VGEKGGGKNFQLLKEVDLQYTTKKDGCPARESKTEGRGSLNIKKNSLSGSPAGRREDFPPVERGKGLPGCKIWEE